MDFSVIYLNESKNKFSSVLYGVDDFVSTHIAWLVISADCKQLEVTLPEASTVGFSCQMNGKDVSIDPVFAPSGSSWKVILTDDSNIILVEDQVQDFEPSDGIRVQNSTSFPGNINLYKSERLFISVSCPPGEVIIFPKNPRLFFGLTKKDIKRGDVFDSKSEKIFSPLAQLDRSYFTDGMRVSISDNPVGRPHVIIDKLQ
jgi:hypothetical protein